MEEILILEENVFERRSLLFSLWFNLVWLVLFWQLNWDLIVQGRDRTCQNYHYYSEGICRVFRMQISHGETVFLRLHVCVEDNLVILLKEMDIVSVIFAIYRRELVELIKTH